MMYKELSKSVSIMFKLVLLINSVLMILLALLGYFLYLSGMNQISELGGVAVRAFSMAKPRAWHMQSYDVYLKEFTDELSHQSSVINLIIYTDGLQTLFEYGAYNPAIQLLTDFPDKPVIKDGLMIFYSKYDDPYRAWHGSGKHSRAHMGSSQENTVYLSLAVDASSLNSTVFLRNLCMVVVVLMQVLLILSFIKLKKLVSGYEKTQERVRILSQEALTGRFASILAHEIKNPLSSIKGLAGYSIKKVEDGQIKESLSRCIDEVDRLTNIVNSFLTFGKPIDLSYSEFGIISLLDKARLLLEHDIDSKNKTLMIHGGDFKIKGDFNRLLQVVVNLLMNALEETEETGTVEVMLHGKKMRIINRVHGEPFANHNKYFEPFYTTKTQGTGLGLAISKKILDIHNFDITISVADNFCVEIDFSRGAYDTDNRR